MTGKRSAKLLASEVRLGRALGAKPARAEAGETGPRSARRLLRVDLPVDPRREQGPTKRPRLPVTENELKDIKAAKARTEGEQGDEECTSTGSSSEGETERGRRAQALSRRGASRRRKYLEAVMEGTDTGQTFLETRAVRAPTRERYMAVMRRFNSYAESQGLLVQGAAEIDAALEEWFEHCFFRGEMPATGEIAMAALMHLMPEFSRCGSAKVPRAWRALKGWRLFSPVKTRKPVPWPVWTALAWRLVEAGRLRAAVFVLLLVSTYLRPSELLGARAEDLNAPAASVVQHWSLLVAPERRMTPTKTGIFSDSVLLDAPYTSFLEPMIARLANQPKGTPLWDFSRLPQEGRHRARPFSACVPGPAQRAIDRPSAGSADAGGCSEERSVGLREISDPIRATRPAGHRVEQAQRRATGALP